MSDQKVLHTIQQPSQFQFMIFCPGCKCGHGIRVGQSDGPNWTFNGNIEKPTFTPSLLTWGVKTPPVDEATGDYARDEAGKYKLDEQGRLLGCKNWTCHSNITDGQIQFHSDSTHELSGQTVPLEPF